MSFQAVPQGKSPMAEVVPLGLLSEAFKVRREGSPEKYVDQDYQGDYPHSTRMAVAKLLKKTVLFHPS